MPDGLSISLIATASRFAANMRRFLDATTQDTAVAVQESALQAVGATRALTPVDTGDLRNSWSLPRAHGPLSVLFGTTLPYAPVVEYGGYPGLGPRTVHFPGGELGDYLLGAGIFSSQAPGGMLRRALAVTKPHLYGRIATSHQRRWGN